MKKDLQNTISLIYQALNSTSSDFACTSLRGYLVAALNEANHLTKKRARKENSLQEMITKGTSFHDQWWNQIKENVKNSQ